MATATLVPADSTRPQLIAPVRHTLALIVLFALLTASGALFQSRAQSHPAITDHHPNVLPLYLSLIAAEWGLFYYIWKGGLKKSGTSVRSLIGGRWSSGRDLLADALLAAAMWGVWAAFTLGWERWMAPGHAASVQSMLPQGALEAGLWIALSISAGICEEAVFRGYFQSQLHAWTGSRWIALALQALLFGISHGYQGVTACFKIALYGAFFGAIALWRRSLRPGMMAHAWTDIASGLLFR